MYKVKFSGCIWIVGEKGGWYFITIPCEISQEMRLFFKSHQRPFNTLPLKVTLGSTTWKTSAFYDTELKSYLLPVKKEVRKKEKLNEGDLVEVEAELS